jgi:hypothetical protein
MSHVDMKYAVVLRKATRNVREKYNMHTDQFLKNFVNTELLYIQQYEYITMFIFSYGTFFITAGLSLVDLVTCLILSLKIV